MNAVGTPAVAMPKRAAPDSPAELDNAKISCRADFQEIAARYHRDQLVLIEGGGAANWSFAELAAAWADAPAWVAARASWCCASIRARWSEHRCGPPVMSHERRWVLAISARYSARLLLSHPIREG